MKKFNLYEESVDCLDEVDQSDFGQLSLARKRDGWTVAHYLAFTGKLSEKYMSVEVLNLSTSNGWSVAHQLAVFGDLPKKYKTINILLLESDAGEYVYEKLPEYRGLNIDKTENWFYLYLLAISKYNYPKVSYKEFKELVNRHGLEKMKQMVKFTGNGR